MTRLRKLILIVSLLAVLPFAKGWVVRGWDRLRPLEWVERSDEDHPES